jgi:hypothetical protein
VPAELIEDTLSIDGINAMTAGASRSYTAQSRYQARALQT